MIDERGEWTILNPLVTQDTTIRFCLAPGQYEVLGSEGGICSEGWGGGYVRVTNMLGSELLSSFTVEERDQVNPVPTPCIATTTLTVEKDASLPNNQGAALFERNRATGQLSGFCGAGCGGALYLEGLSSTATIDNTVFALNSAADGGALFVDLLGEISLFRVTMRNNSASLNGGAMNVGTAATVDVTQSTANSNIAGGSGGMLHMSDVGAAALEEVVATGNIAGTNGGAVAVFDVTRSTVTLKNSIMRRNKALKENGGGVYAENSEVGVYGVEFIENSVELGDGGGVATRGPLTNFDISETECVNVDVLLDWTTTDGSGCRSSAYGQTCLASIVEKETTCSAFEDATYAVFTVSADCSGCTCNNGCVPLI
jgi:hypothetical protein